MSRRPFDCILFDLDGTLVDSLADIASAVNDLRSELGLCPVGLSEVRAAIGDGAWALLRRTLPEGTYGPQHLERFLVHYDRRLLEQTRPYPGVEALLTALADCRLALITNKPLALTRRLLDGLGLKDRFALVLGAESCLEKKPHPAPLLHAMERLGASSERTLMVGDHHTDLLAGRAACVRTCFCTWGLGERGEAFFDYRADSPAELQRLLAGKP